MLTLTRPVIVSLPKTDPSLINDDDRAYDALISYNIMGTDLSISFRSMY